MVTMVLTQDILHTIRDLFYDHWAAADPTQATIGTTHFFAGPRESIIRAPAIGFRTDRENYRERSGGSKPFVLVYHYLFIDVYALDDDELHKMKEEIMHILEDERMTPGGGIHHLEYAGDWRPMSHLTHSRENVSSRLRIVAVYWRIPS